MTLRTAAVTFLVVAAVTLGAAAMLDRPALQTGDNKGTIFPLVLESWRQVRAGRLPEWSDLCWAGTPLVGNGAIGALYAPYLPGFVLTPAPHLRAFDIAAALHAGWFAAGSVMLLGALGVSPALAVAGTCLVLMSRFANWTAFAFIAAYVALSWWPWALFAAERLARSASASGALLLGAIALAAQVVAGFPEHAFSAGIAAAVWILLRSGGQPLRRRLARIGLLALGSAALSAPVIFPMLTQMQEAGFATAKPFPGLAALLPTTLDRLIDVRTSAEPAGPLTLGFVGLVTAALAIVGATRAPVLGGFLVFALLMALGDHTPWYPAVRALPGFSLSRNPIKFVAFVEVLAAWLAAIGLARLRGDGSRGRAALTWSLVALAVAERAFAQGMTLPSYVAMSGGPSSVAAVRAGLVEGGLVSRMGTTSPPTKVLDGAGIREDLQGLLLNCVPAIDGVATFHGGMLNLVAARHLHLDVTVTRPALQRFGIDAAVGYGDYQCDRLSEIWDLRRERRGNPLCVLWTPDPRPTYELVHRVVAVASDEELVEAARSGPSDAVPVVASAEAVADLHPPGRPGTVTVRSYRAGAIDLHSVTDDPAVLLLRHKWHPGWSAEIDGKTAPLWRALGLYMAIPVSPGDHEVRLRYREPGLRSGLAIAAAWLCFACAIAFRR